MCLDLDLDTKISRSFWIGSFFAFLFIEKEAPLNFLSASSSFCICPFLFLRTYLELL